MLDLARDPEFKVNQLDQLDLVTSIDRFLPLYDELLRSAIGTRLGKSRRRFFLLQARLHRDMSELRKWIAHGEFDIDNAILSA